MWRFLRKLLSISDTYEEFVPNLNQLSPPSKKAVAKRNKKVKESIERMGDKHLNVPFKKVEQPPLASVSKIKKSA
jgi:hypothetical protein